MDNNIKRVYGNNVVEMVSDLKTIEDKQKRTRQAYAIVKNFETKPVSIPMKDIKIRAYHYGRNIERILDLLAEEPDGETKTALIRSLAIYMRTQYLIWNKDSVADETIFADIEKLSEGRVIVPEGLTLSKLDAGANFSRPGIGNQSGTSRNGKQYGKRNKGNFKNNKHR